MTDEMEEIWLLYVDDGSQSLDAVERAVTLLRDRPNDTGAIGLLFRSMHTFKGNSRILGLATIEHTAHIAEDLIGIVRDEGVPIDAEIIELLIEAADTLRAMMDRAYRSRADEPAEGGFDLPMRLKDKISRCRADGGGQTPAITAVEANSDDDDAPFAEALLFDAASIRLADDPVYREIFFETARAALDQMHEAANSGGRAGTAERLLGAIADVREVAGRIAMPEWPEATLAAEAALRADTDPAIVLAQLEELYRYCTVGASAVCGRSPSSSSGPGEASGVAGGDTEALVPGPIVSALAVILGQARGGDDIDCPSVVAGVQQITTWATECGLYGIVDACQNLAACPTGGARFDAASIRLADYLSRVEGSPEGGATRQLEQWSFAHSPRLLGELSNAIAGPVIDWRRVAADLDILGPACAGYGWHTAREVVQLLADICCRVRDGELAADSALPGIVEGLVAGLRLALESGSRDGGPDFAAAEAILTETATAAERLCRDPALSEMERSLGLPECFHGALTADSAKKLRAAIEAGQNLYVIRGDLGQDQALADNFMEWLVAPGRSCICSVTVYSQGSTAFDYLVATKDEHPELRAVLSTIARGSSALSLVSAVGQPAGAATDEAIVDGSGSDGCVDADALSEIVGELATARSATRQVLAGFIEADLPAQADRMMQEFISNPRVLREELSRMIAGWQDKIEQVLQVEAKAATDLDQLSEIAARIRQRPAGPMLARIAAWGRKRADERKVSVVFSCVGAECAIDVSHVATLEAALREAIESRLLQAAATSAIEIEVTPRDTTVEATVTVTHCAVGGADQAGHATNPLEETTADRVEMLLSPVAGYATTEQLRGGGSRTRLVIPRRTSMVDGMIVRVSDTKYVLPVHSIQRIVETTHGAIVRVSAQSSQTLLKLSRDEVLPVQSLGPSGRRAQSLDDHGEGSRHPDHRAVVMKNADEVQLFVITSTRDGRIAVPVDELLGQESIVVRPVQGYLSSLRAVAGCTILAAGDVGIVVDPNAIARAAA